MVKQKYDPRISVLSSMNVLSIHVPFIGDYYYTTGERLRVLSSICIASRDIRDIRWNEPSIRRSGIPRFAYSKVVAAVGGCLLNDRDQ